LLFGLWAVLDVVLYATTGNDSVYYVADWMGWIEHPVNPGDTITVVTGMEFTDFLVVNSIPITIVFLLLFCVWFFATRDLNERA